MRRYLASFTILSFAVLSARCSSQPPQSDAGQSEIKARSPVQAAQGDENSSEFSDQNDSQTKKQPAINSSAIPSSEFYGRFNQARLMHQTRRSEELAGEILARNPNDIKVLNALAVLYIEQEKFELARLVIAKILEKTPNASAAMNNLGIIELRTNNLRQALVSFKKAIEMDEGNRSAHANLGTIYLRYRNYQSAAAELDAAVSHGDKSPETLSNLGYALAGLGKKSEAEKAYEKATNRDNPNSAVLLNYAALLIERGSDVEKGMKIINKIRFVAHEPVILERADILARKAANSKKVSQEKENPIEKPSE